MTVKDAVRVLKSANAVALRYGDDIVPFDKDNPLSMEAFGQYLVAEIRGSDDDYYEISVAMRPAKMGEM